ncbi:MAG TPA: pyruvate dehydrogenase complex dihydrolipoamide acetyltransferase [Gemmatimonadetes bacterium]|jgi:pyruvate dehydrogenase E2 component (dihydrolipoamide acetyltransferase)|nr:pyruvate dehydrogenase complex dihydrolipoamide acetyltransferase [Gemmatimonadota bacterium]HIC14098.1 pyruvate dehydrogenase complex dihydrolipoamide acetyltransferase [Gemmatimonadota bacterium]
MVTKVHMEALSPTMEEGQLVQWLKSEGDEVSSGDILAEIETDKATMELVARGDGILRKIFLDAGGVSAVGSVIAVIATADEDISGVKGALGGDDTQEASSEEPTEAETVVPEEPEAATISEITTPTHSGSSVRASPLARKLATEMGVDLQAIKGSGPGGRVVKRDLEGVKTLDVTAAVAATWTSEEKEYEDVPTSQMRKSIAKRLVTSIGPVPTFYLTVEVDMNRVIEARKSMNSMLDEDGFRISVNDIILKAVAAALRQNPNCNAQWHDNFVRRFNAVHLGVAVAIDEGLITPVIRNAHAKGIMQIASEVRELATRARTKKLMPDEYTGSTFSVSNLGMFGIHEFTAIINPPEAGILAVGGIEETPVVVNGEVKVLPRVRITMSCDHRVIDGAQGARFLATLKSMLEEPAAILL